jgi:outer membrane protein
MFAGVGTVKADHEYAFTPSVEYFFGETPFSAELLLAAPTLFYGPRTNKGV